MRAMRYQPQGRNRLSAASRIAKACQALLLGSSPLNLATGQRTTSLGSLPFGNGKRATGGGIADSFRGTHLRATELLPTIGTQPYIEFWVGYPTYDAGTVNSSSEVQFVTGSSNNSTGIATKVGTRRTIANGPTISNSWGCAYDWSGGAHVVQANHVLTPNVLTCLLTVRDASGISFWCNGVLVSRVERTPTNHGASKFIVGSFIESTTNWPTSSDMLMAGRAIIDLPPAEAQAFSSNPWQLFAAPEIEELPSQAQPDGGTLVVTPAALMLGGGEVVMRVSRRLGVQPAALDLGAGEIKLKAARRTAVAAADLALQSGTVQLRATRRLTVAPLDMMVTGGAIQFTYAAAPGAGGYDMAIAPAALSLAGGNVEMRVTRRLKIESASLVLAGHAMTFTDSVTGTPIDATSVPAARTVVFAGGARVINFNGGTRVVDFAGGIRTVRF